MTVRDLIDELVRPDRLDREVWIDVGGDPVALEKLFAVGVEDINGVPCVVLGPHYQGGTHASDLDNPRAALRVLRPRGLGGAGDG